MTTDDGVEDIPPPAGMHRPATISSVITEWRARGPLVHEPTGITRLDELTGGGPVYGTRWFLAGAPDAGKTALLAMIAHVFLARGIAVGLLAVDEEGDDLVTRLAQRIGYERSHCELRDPRVLEEIGTALGGLPLLIYDDSWTIEAAAADLATYARERADADPVAHPHGPRALLGIDSLQTVTCDKELVAGSSHPPSMHESVTARTRAIRAVATRYRLITMTTSELTRSVYGQVDPDRRTSVLAGGKWSGSIEYGARVLIGVQNVAGEKDILDLEIAKNKHGPRDEHVYLRIDRRAQTLTECNYAPLSVEDRATVLDVRKRDRTLRDAGVAAVVVANRPGVVRGALEVAVRTAACIGSDRARDALGALGHALVVVKGRRGAQIHYLDGSDVPRAVLETLSASDRATVEGARPPAEERDRP